MSPHPPLRLSAGTNRGGGGTGIRAMCRAADGVWHVGPAYSGALDASFSVQGKRHGLHYIVDEHAGRVGVHRYDGMGWTLLASIAVEGAGPCHVALNPAETLLATANYASGSVSVLHLDAQTGLPTGRIAVRANHGSGPNPQRQKGPHAHWVGFDDDGRWLYQTDLGTDEVLAFAVDDAGTLGPSVLACRAPAGSGPRHLLLHPRLWHRAYLASELANTLTVLDRAGEALTRRRIVSTLPGAWQGESIVAHLAVNRAADRLYVSNRGHGSIAVFALDAEGWPTLVQHAPAGGTSPRFFLVLEDARLVAVAHEREQTVAMLAIAADGRLLPTDTPPLSVAGVGYLLMP